MVLEGTRGDREMTMMTERHGYEEKLDLQTLDTTGFESRIVGRFGMGKEGKRI